MNRDKEIIKTLRKIIEDKKCVMKYIKGEMSLDEIKERGIKFATPI